MNGSNMINRLKSFRKREDGAVTVETVLWFPLFFFLFLFVVELSIMLNRYTLTLRSVQDANRNVAVGNYTTATLETAIKAEVANFTTRPVITTQTSVDGTFQTNVTIQAVDFLVTPWPEDWLDIVLTISATHQLENLS